MRYQRDLRIRWDTYKLDSYTRYVTSVVHMARIAGQIAGLHGWDDLAVPADEQNAPRALDEAEVERTAAFERVVLVGDQQCIAAGHSLNRSVWAMEWIARGLQAGSREVWQETRDRYVTALGSFHEHARKSLQVTGPFLMERNVERPQASQTE
jgi:hypothetical protein